VEKSRTFRREGADVHSDVVVSLSQAILGGTIRIPGIAEQILLNVSPSVACSPVFCAFCFRHCRMLLSGQTSSCLPGCRVLLSSVLPLYWNF